MFYYDLEMIKWRPPPKPPGPTIHDLPDDILQHIFKRLQESEPLTETYLPLKNLSRKHPYSLAPIGGIHHPLQCAFVCKRWWAAADGAIEHLYLNRPLTVTDAFTRHLSRFENLTSLSFLECKIAPRHGGNTHTFFTRLAAVVPQLQELYIQPPERERDRGLASDLATAIPKWTSLHTLYLGELIRSYTDPAGLLSLLDSLPSAPLRELTFHYSVAHREVSVEIVCKKLRQIATLEHLELEVSDMPPAFMAEFTPLRNLTLDNVQHEHLPFTLGSFRSLTGLTVSKCRRLVALPNSVGSLSALQYIGIINCDALRSLPETLGTLPALQIMYIYGSGALMGLPESLGSLRSLSSLKLHGCDSLRALPGSIHTLSCLTSLYIEDCCALSQLPWYIGYLSRLHELTVKRTAISQIPSEIWNLSRLVSLNVSDCATLSVIPESIRMLSRLKVLDLSDCPCLQKLPAHLCQLQSLEDLRLGGCSALSELPRDIGGLSQLRSLDVSRWYKLKELPDSLCELANLKVLNLNDCFSLESLPGDVWPRLEQGSLVLHTEGCDALDW